jgi:hypothetical protein
MIIGNCLSIPFRSRPGIGSIGYPSILDDGNTVAWYDYLEHVTKDGSDLVSVWGDKIGYGLGAVLNVSNCVNLNYTTFTSATATGFNATSNGSTTHFGGTADEMSITSSKSYIVEFSMVLNSGTGPWFRFEDAFGSFARSNQVLAVNGVNRVILTATSTTTVVLAFRNISTVTNYQITNLSVKELLGNNLLQSTGTNQPLETATGILFDGVDNFMKTAPFVLEQPEFIYMVIKQVSWTNFDFWFDGENPNRGAVYQTGTTPNLVAFAGAGSTGNANLAVNTYGIVRVLFNGVSSKFIVNKTTPVTGNFGNSDMGGFLLGSRMDTASGFANIEVSECIIRKVADNPTDEAAIYSYLSKKYGI